MISFEALRLVWVDISPEDLCSARCIVMRAPAMDILFRRTSQSCSPAVVLKGQRFVDAVNDCSEKVTAHWLIACPVLPAKLNRCVAHLLPLQLSDSQNEQGKKKFQSILLESTFSVGFTISICLPYQSFSCFIDRWLDRHEDRSNHYGWTAVVISLT